MANFYLRFEFRVEVGDYEVQIYVKQLVVTNRK